MLEKDIENLIAQYPDEFFPNAGFKLEGQQVSLGRFYADIIFTDKYSRKIIVELKKGVLSRKASGQIIDYYGILKSQRPQETIELILCANVIPQERRLFLENVGIECKEVSEARIKEVAEKYGYKFIDGRREENIDKRERMVSSVIHHNYDGVTITKNEAKESLDKLVAYLKQILKHTDLKKPSASRAYRMLERHFPDFKDGKDKIEIDAAAFDRYKDYFGSTTEAELIETANVFGYKIELIKHSKKTSRQYYKGAIFSKI